MQAAPHGAVLFYSRYFPDYQLITSPFPLCVENFSDFPLYFACHSVEIYFIFAIQIFTTMKKLPTYQKRVIFEAIRTVEALNPPSRPFELLLTLRAICHRFKDDPMLLDCLEYYLSIQSNSAQPGVRYYLRYSDADEGVLLFLCWLTDERCLRKLCIAKIWGVSLRDLGL